MRRILIALGAIAALAAITFLFSRREAPYSQAAPTYDERGPQQRAVIELSDPQVYARETLLNDRLVESGYLADQLAQSATVPLKPQIKRELEVFEQLMVDLKGRTESAAEANRQTEPVKHHRTERPDAGQTPAGAAENKTEQTHDEKSEGDQDAHSSDSTARVAEDQKQAPKRETLSDSDGAPEEAYLDRQAFREKIRSDLAAVNLDDLHDFEGNALFRLQFRATVFPGEHKDKFGVVRVSINPPELTSHDVRQLYLAWLAHATFRLNEVDENGQITANYLYRVLSGSGLYGIAYYPLSNNRSLSLAVNPQYTQDTIELIREYRDQNWIDSSQNLLEGLQQIYNIARYGNLWGNDYKEWQEQATSYLDKVMGGLAARRDLSVCLKLGADPPPVETSLVTPLLNGKSPREELGRAISSLRLSPSLSSILVGIAGQQRLPKEAQEEVAKLSAFLARVTTWATNYFDLLNDIQQLNEVSCRFSAEKFARDGSDPPEPFLKSIFRDGWTPPDSSSARDFSVPRGLITSQKQTDAPVPARGHAIAYGTTPTALSQRLSTLASAGHKLELSLALAAANANAGVGFSEGTGYVRRATGLIDTLEHVPVVVGFSDRLSFILPDKSNELAPTFGWAFGPQVYVEPANGSLTFRHDVANYSVTADISAPGWWPRLEMTVETAWVGNWYEHVNPVGKLAEVLDSDVQPTRMIVTTPRNRADYDGLTQLLAVLNLGTTVRQVMISYVEPSKIPACADELSFLVFGPELWRGAEGFLNGIRHSDLTVLPDMGGIHLKFKLDRSKDNPAQWFALPRTLTVATRLGAASKEIRLLDDGSKCPREVTNTPADPPSTNTSAAPSSTVLQQYDAVSAENKELKKLLEQSQAQQRFVEAGDLLFPAGGFQISTTGQAELTKNILPRLRGLQNVKIVVYGYTDNTPVRRELQRMHIRSNLDLSTLRAATVATYLTSGGVDPNIVSAKGFGETHPVDTNDTPGGRAANRRIEITIQGPGAPGS